MLVKLPKEVNRIMTRLEEAGFEAYIAGECVKDSVLGQHPFGWDISTNAGIGDMKKLFPDGDVLSEKYQVMRFEYIDEVVDREGDVEAETGIIIDLGKYRKEAADSAKKLTAPAGDEDKALTIEDDLGRRGFTVDAIAENQREIIDPFGGRDDIRNKLIRTVKDADETFRDRPALMLQAVRMASQTGFDLHRSVYEAILRNRELLGKVSPDKIRDEFSMLVSAKGHAGKGLGMLLDTGMVAAVIGQDVVDRLTKREMQDLTILSRNIDRTQPVEARRLGLFFTCIDKRKILPAIERLNFDEETHQHLTDAVKDMPKLYFTATKPALKKFIYERGMDRYEYLLSIEKAQRIVFEYHSDTKIKSKMYMLDEIKKYREPIFPEDLKVDANDLIEAGICTRDNVDKVLRMMTEELHTHPRKNTREELMKLAKLYSKNKVAAALRGIHWTR